MSEYLIKQTEVSDSHINEYSNLLSKIYIQPNKFTPQYIEWLYVKNPMGKVIGFDAYHNQQLAAHYVTIPVKYLVNGYTVSGLLSLNTATHNEHQGKGLFVNLAQKTYSLASKLGYKFVIGVANQNSTHGFVTKLGFDLVSPLNAYLGIGSIQYNQKSEFYMSSIWEPNSLKWRLSNPINKYYHFKNGYYSNTHISLVKCKITSYNSEVNNDYKLTDTIPFELNIGLNIRKTPIGLNLKLPDYLKPSPLNLIFKNLSEQKIDINKSNIYFECIDFDAY